MGYEYEIKPPEINVTHEHICWHCTTVLDDDYHTDSNGYDVCEPCCDVCNDCTCPDYQQEYAADCPVHSNEAPIISTCIERVA